MNRQPALHFRVHTGHSYAYKGGLQRKLEGERASSWIFDKAQRRPCKVCLMLFLEISKPHCKYAPGMTDVLKVTKKGCDSLHFVTRVSTRLKLSSLVKYHSIHGSFKSIINSIAINSMKKGQWIDVLASFWSSYQIKWKITKITSMKNVDWLTDTYCAANKHWCL